MRPLILLGDLHLTRATPGSVAEDLARLVRAHPGSRLCFSGDSFDLSAEQPARPTPRAVREVLGAHPALRRALAEHLEGGGELFFVSGNHDAEVGEPGFRPALLDALGAPPRLAPGLRTTPWFFREGGLHVEHGHRFDPDNAPEHPLFSREPSLGSHFVREFLAPTGAFRFLNANDGTPLRLFLSSFAWYGPRAPYVIYRYFHAALTAILRSGPLYRARDEAPRGRAREALFAEEAEMPDELVRALAELGERPTLESLEQTFARLYLDRVVATSALLAGALASGLGARRRGLLALALGAALMLASWARGHDRYKGSVAMRLREGARLVAETSGARLVVFGHTHREALEPGYANTGSFSFPGASPGRPYLLVEGPPDAPRAVRRHLFATSS